MTYRYNGSEEETADRPPYAESFVLKRAQSCGMDRPVYDEVVMEILQPPQQLEDYTFDLNNTKMERVTGSARLSALKRFREDVLSLKHLRLGERGLHVLQQTGQILLTVTHHQEQTETGHVHI